MPLKEKKVSKKDIALEQLLKNCITENNFVFHNTSVKEISRKIGVGNPFDVSKLDTEKTLPKILRENDFAILHLGSGYHILLKGIKKLYHSFEPIQHTIEWKYKKSLLNQYNTSESNVLSVANNQRILHHFLFGKDTELDDVDIISRPKTYFPHRTKTSFTYYFGKEKIECNKIQIEIDLTIEYQGTIGIFECKNGKPTTFNICQLYHPFLYYYTAKQKPEYKETIKDIICVYLVKAKSNNTINLWAYTFTNPFDITSIKFIKSAAYQFINQK